MAGMSPTQLSLRKLKSEGYETVQVVEVWIPSFGNRAFGNRRDLFGCWDILAVKDGETVAIQVTSKSNMSARIKKIADIEPHTKNLREANWTLLVHGWFKNKSNRWEVKEVDVS
jgi:hypothetical protein